MIDSSNREKARENNNRCEKKAVKMKRREERRGNEVKISSENDEKQHEIVI